MDINKYIQENKLVVSPYVTKMCDKALSIMSKSIDPMHDLAHVVRILDSYARYKKDVSNEIHDDDIMLLSICWHDVWKAKRNPGNFAAFFYDQLAEGIFTSRIFSNYHYNHSTDAKTRREVSYAIRKHSAFQLLPHKTLYSRLLWDLDELDEWNFQRVVDAGDNFFVMRSKKTLKAFRHYMRLENGRSLHTKWAKREFREHTKEKFFNDIDREIKSRSLQKNP